MEKARAVSKKHARVVMNGDTCDLVQNGMKFWQNGIGTFHTYNHLIGHLSDHYEYQSIAPPNIDDMLHAVEQEDTSSSNSNKPITEITDNLNLISLA